MDSSAITVLVSSSPIISHPSTQIIDETLRSIREQLPNSPIIIMQDGVREEQLEYKQRYEQYLANLKPDDKTTVMPFITHQHQAGMTQQALMWVTTPYILFVEHDTPLWGDIPFATLCRILSDRDANVIRFMFEASILDEHQYLMFGEAYFHGVSLTRTRQWSQRPHLASTDYYKEMLAKYFPATARTFIEDKMYGIMEVAYNERGLEGWEEFKLWIYTPPGDMKRSLNLDGRGSDPKYALNFD